MTIDEKDSLRIIIKYVNQQLNKTKRMTSEKYCLLVRLMIVETMLSEAK